ncbi:WecB/TagA/CpsF family glycosyltransferase, partial [Nonomuraea ceibae]|uniref:WecB/TagA/CpsF family glycosyltransferase n=1 Tax=Nonomuraea ceibae TaxID=1935170 RepID=UPI0027DF2C13
PPGAPHRPPATLTRPRDTTPAADSPTETLPRAAVPEGAGAGALRRGAAVGGRRSQATQEALPGRPRAAVLEGAGSPGVLSAGRRVVVGGVGVDAVTEAEVVDWVSGEVEAGRGGQIVTPNVDICRAVARDAGLRELVRRAEVVVADGMPLVWASRISGTPLPERVTGADLIWSLSARAARRGWPVYLLGGPPGAAEGAAGELALRCPGLDVRGAVSPPYGFDARPAERERVMGDVVRARPRLVFVGLGFPRQELLIGDLRQELPGAWFLGCGAAIAFAAGTVPRAPGWMRRAGLEWAFRLGSEPGRLARRYLVDDLPFAVRLLLEARRGVMRR